MVLEFGWAYGPGGNMLAGKMIFNAITTGGAPEAYSTTGHNRFTVTQFLAPFDQTATLCKMIYLPPFVMQGTHRLTDQSLVDQTTQYRLLLEKLLAGDFDVEQALKLTSLNQLLESINQ